MKAGKMEMSEPQAEDFTAKQVRSLLMVLPFVIAIGLGITGWGAYLVQFHVDLLQRGETSTGVVVALERGSSASSSGRVALFPVVEFETVSGQSITFRHRTGQSPPAYREGERVTLTYLPDDPQAALIAEGFMNWLLPGLLLLIGPALAVVALRGILAVRRQLAQRPHIVERP